MTNHTAFQQPIVALKITPLDPLFFRDGRPFGEGSTRGTSGLPMPRTLSGMVRWHLMKKMEVSPRNISKDDHGHWISRLAVRGPWLAKFGSENQSVDDVYVTPPAHLVRVGKDKKVPLQLLSPLRPGTPLPGWREGNPYEGQPQLSALWGGWKKEPFRPVEGSVLSLKGLQQVLEGKAPDDNSLLNSSDLFQAENRVGVGIDSNSQTAAEGLLYSVSMLRLAEHIGFYAELGAEGNDPKASSELKKLFIIGSSFIAPFGGEGRRVSVEVIEKPIKWPQAPATATSNSEAGGFTTMLVSPACFAPRVDDRAKGRQFPPHPLGTLVSAAIGRAVGESGWQQTARNHSGSDTGRAQGAPRPTRMLVPGGSTYFWQRGTRATRNEPLPESWQLAQTPLERSLGYGLALRGAWQWWQ